MVAVCPAHWDNWGLATLAGVSIGDGESSESQIAQEIMKSWSFIESFIADNDLSVEVFAAEGWSKGSNELHINQDAYDSISGEWLTGGLKWEYSASD